MTKISQVSARPWSLLKSNEQSCEAVQATSIYVAGEKTTTHRD